jgi:hypothetical protein
MGLTDLSQELLFQVLYDDAIGLYERYNLARVDRRMHQLLVPLLYQTVHIDIGDSRTEDSQQRTLLFFQKTLSENAGLANLVRNLDISWHGNQYPFEESSPGNRIIIEPDIEQSIGGILSCISRLQTLALRRLSDGQLPTFYAPEIWGGPYKCLLFSGNRLNELRELKLVGLTVDIESMALVVQLPRLEVLESQGLAHRFEVDAENYTIQSKLKSLSLGPLCKPGPDTRLMLRWCGALETLSYDLGVYMGRRDMPDHPTLSQLLAPQINTLVELTLIGADYTSIHMNSIDLSVFSSLKRLRSLTSYFFHATFPCTKRKHLSEMGSIRDYRSHLKALRYECLISLDAFRV